MHNTDGTLNSLSLNPFSSPSLPSFPIIVQLVLGKLSKKPTPKPKRSEKRTPKQRHSEKPMPKQRHNVMLTPKQRHSEKPTPKQRHNVMLTPEVKPAPGLRQLAATTTRLRSSWKSPKANTWTVSSEQTPSLATLLRATRRRTRRLWPVRF